MVAIETEQAHELEIDQHRAPGRRNTPRRLGEAMLSFEAVIVVSVMALILAAIPRTMGDLDLWWHLRNAQWMLATHAFIRHDLFTYTAQGSPWIDHEWLSELPFYLGWRSIGPAGVYLVTAAVIEAIFAGVLWLCWRASGSCGIASVATLTAAFLSTVSFGPRTLLFGWLCFVAQLILLERSRERPMALLAAPALYAFWVNLHGSWVIGLTVLAIFTVLGHVRLPGEWIRPDRFTRRHSRTLLWTWASILPALFCNPWGWRLIAYPFNFAFRQTLNVANVIEWRSLDLHSARGRIVLAAILLVVGKQLWRPRTWFPTELAFVALGLYSAFNYSRFLFLLALLAAPAAARSFARRIPTVRVSQQPTTKRVLNALLLAAVLALVAVSYRRDGFTNDAGMGKFPVHALPALDHLDPQRRLFNEYLWGGFLEWNRSNRQVFIDSRVDIFEYNGTFKDYLDIVHINNSLALLDRYKIEYVFFEKDTPLVYLLCHSGMWKSVYDDGKNVLLERTQLALGPCLM